MPSAILNRINWVDIFVVIFLFRICYVAAKTGLPIEIFKLFGALASIYLSIHYSTGLTDFIRQQLSILKLPLHAINFISFLFLAIFGYMVFVLLRNVIYKFVKLEAVSALNKWGGLVIGALRALLLIGLIIFTLVFSGASYFRNSVKSSYSGKYFLNVAPQVYTWLWQSLISKFSSEEKINKNLLDDKNDASKK